MKTKTTALKLFACIPCLYDQDIIDNDNKRNVDCSLGGHGFLKSLLSMYLNSPFIFNM